MPRETQHASQPAIYTTTRMSSGIEYVYFRARLPSTRQITQDKRRQPRQHDMSALFRLSYLRMKDGKAHASPRALAPEKASPRRGSWALLLRHSRSAAYAHFSHGDTVPNSFASARQTFWRRQTTCDRPFRHWLIVAAISSAVMVEGDAISFIFRPLIAIFPAAKFHGHEFHTLFREGAHDYFLRLLFLYNFSSDVALLCARSSWCVAAH